ncbi:MAG: helix-turn-helix transcriptional regulator [Phycisphaerales bacterium]|nr:helix-turn-helix transcriptional regulator [Phycisphaerales bacterium]
MPPQPLTIRNTIRARADDMTQQELADRVGVSRQTINAIEGAKHSPSLEVAFRIARVFSERVDDVFECLPNNR